MKNITLTEAEIKQLDAFFQEMHLQFNKLQEKVGLVFLLILNHIQDGGYIMIILITTFVLQQKHLQEV